MDWSFFTMNVLHFRLETSAMLQHRRADGGSFKQSCGRQLCLWQSSPGRPAGRQFDRYDKIYGLPYFQYARSVSSGICSRWGEDQNSVDACIMLLAAAQVSEAGGRLLASQMNSCQLLLSAVTLPAGAHSYTSGW